MIKWIYNHYSPLPPVFIDGALYVLMGMGGVLEAAFAGDEAKQFIDPTWLFWLKTIVAAVVAGALYLKTFRSTAFAEHRAAKEGGGTATYFKQASPPK